MQYPDEEELWQLAQKDDIQSTSKCKITDLGLIISLSVLAFIFGCCLGEKVFAETPSDMVGKLQEQWKVCDEYYDPRLPKYEACRSLLRELQEAYLKEWKLNLEIPKR